MKNNTALLIIDVQTAMFDDPAFQPYKGQELLDNISSLIREARDADIPIIYIQHSETEGVLKRGTPSWEIHAQISPSPQDHVVEKTSWDGFLNTSLDETLKSLNIETLYVMGMQTEFCVDTTLRRAYSMGYQSFLIADAHSTYDNEVITAEQIVKHHSQIWGVRFATLIKASDVTF